MYLINSHTTPASILHPGIAFLTVWILAAVGGGRPSRRRPPPSPQRVEEASRAAPPSVSHGHEPGGAPASFSVKAIWIAALALSVSTLVAQIATQVAYGIMVKSNGGERMLPGGYVFCPV